MSLDRLQGLSSGEAVALEGAALLPVEAGVAALPALRVSSGDAARLMRGQAVLLRGRDAPVLAGWVSGSSQNALVGPAGGGKGGVRPRRAFHLPRGVWREKGADER